MVKAAKTEFIYLTFRRDRLIQMLSLSYSSFYICPCECGTFVSDYVQAFAYEYLYRSVCVCALPNVWLCVCEHFYVEAVFQSSQTQ